nr:acetoin utilization protein AcuC [Pseudomonadota bacterium]
MTRSKTICVYEGEALSRYGFGGDHPFGQGRLDAFMDELHRRHLDWQVRFCPPMAASDKELGLFHTRAYLDRVRDCSASGQGMLDYGDTPAWPGVYEAACHVVGSTLDAVRKVMGNQARRAFVPIAGLHHGFPDTAAGFCVFNDCGVAIKVLEEEYGLERIAYVDIDAHHGDGVFYPFEDDPRLIFADIHEDGRYNFPQSGFAHETGKGAAQGRKLNLPLLPLSRDADFLRAWEQVEAFLEQWRPQFILMQ